MSDQRERARVESTDSDDNEEGADVVGVVAEEGEEEEANHLRGEQFLTWKGQA